MRLLMRFLSDSMVEKIYTNAGFIFGDAVSYSYFGESANMEQLLKTWEKWENEYALRGFRTVSLDRFVDFADIEQPICDVLGQKRAKEETPIYHAKIYKENYLGKIKPAIDIAKMFKDGKRQSGIFEMPTTESN